MKKKLYIAATVVLLPALAWGLTKLTSVAIVNSTVDSSAIGSSVPSTGVFTALQDTALTGGCVQSTAGGTLATGSCVYPPQRAPLTAPVGMSASVQTVIKSETVTFPATAGNYRADVRYGVWIQAGANACAAQIVDATNNRAFAFSGQNTNGSGFIGLSGSEISTQTYAASSTAIFSLVAICNNGAGGLVGASVNSGLFSMIPAEPTYISVTPIPSN